MNKVLRGYRNMLGMSQTKMGEIINTGKQGYHLKESGKTEFKYNEMLKILKVVNESYPLIAMQELFIKE